MATESDYNRQTIITPISIDDDTVYVPFAEEEPEEHPILIRRRAHGRVRWYDRSLRYGCWQGDGSCRASLLQVQACEHSVNHEPCGDHPCRS